MELISLQMKKPTSHPLVYRSLFFVLLFFSVAISGNAQWTYTTTVRQTGTCIPYPTMGTVPYQTKSACEAARQHDLDQSGSDWSIYGDGSCTTIITCTPCTGSDPGSPNQGGSLGSSGFPGDINPGDASINSFMEGKPLFTPHQSKAFEDWATSYKQLLASYGITSILDKDFKIPRTPLTEDKYFNALYTTLSVNFNPKIAPAVTPDAELPSGTVPLMGGSPLTQAERERQKLPGQSGQQYIDLMTYIRPETGIVESTPATTDLSDSKEYKMMEAFLDKMGDYQVGKLPAFTGKLLLSTINETDKLIRDMTINGKYTTEELAEMNTVKVIINNVATEQVKTFVKDKISSAKENLGLNYLGRSYGKATKAGAEVGLSLMKDAKTLQEIWAAKRY